MKNPKNIVITGASSGIGFALAKSYAISGVNLLLIGRDKQRLAQCAELCVKAGATVISKQCDVRDGKEMQIILTEFDQSYPIDLLIANAGISSAMSDASDIMEQARTMVEINIIGVMNSIYPILENFKSRQNGQIAIMSSMASFRGLPSAPNYSASKASVRFLGQALRGALLFDNIAVNVICPGYIKTPLTDKNNFPMPFLMAADKAALYIKRGLQLNKPLIIFPKIIYYIMMILGLLPNKLSDQIFARLPKK